MLFHLLTKEPDKEDCLPAPDHAQSAQKAKEGVGTILAAYGEIEFALLGLSI